MLPDVTPFFRIWRTGFGGTGITATASPSASLPGSVLCVFRLFLRSGGVQLRQPHQVVREDRRMYPCPEARQTSPAAARRSKVTLEERDAGLHAQRLGLFQVFLRGVTAVEGGVGRRFAIVFTMTFQHGQTASAVCGNSGPHHHIGHQAAAARGQIDLVSVRGLEPALADDVRLRLEQADDLFPWPVRSSPAVRGAPPVRSRYAVTRRTPPPAFAGAWPRSTATASSNSEWSTGSGSNRLIWVMRFYCMMPQAFRCVIVSLRSQRKNTQNAGFLPPASELFKIKSDS